MSDLMHRGKAWNRTFYEVQWFFDGKKVARHVSLATRRVLSRFGAMVRQTARRSIRNAKKKPVSKLTDTELAQKKRTEAAGKTYTCPLMPSEPGQPPRNITGRLKKTIFFRFNPRGRFVDIGPAVGGGASHNMDALEAGGEVRATTSADRGRHTGRRKKHAFFYTAKARPFMRPALAKELPRLEALWKGAVT